MKTKQFHLGDVLSVTTERLVSPRHVDGVYDILNFMTGDNLFTHQLPRANDECKPFLLEQFPQLATPEMDFAVAELGEMLKTKSGKAETEKLVAGWLAKQVAKYGEMFTVKPIPSEKHAVKNPIQEALEMIGPRTKVIAVGI
jgi:hypothetical protein